MAWPQSNPPTLLPPNQWKSLNDTTIIWPVLMGPQWFSPSTCLVPATRWPWLRSFPGEHRQSVGLEKGTWPSWHRTSYVHDGCSPSGWEEWWQQTQFPSSPLPCLFSCFSFPTLFTLPLFIWETSSQFCSANAPGSGHCVECPRAHRGPDPVAESLGVPGPGGIGATEWGPAWPPCDPEGNWTDSTRWGWISPLEWPQSVSLLGQSSDWWR